MRTAVGSFIGAALVVACAGLPLIAGALGGVALVVGVGAAALAGALLVAALTAQRRRRSPLGSKTE